MNATEALRLVIVIVAGANLGFTVALFERVGQYVVPRYSMRAIMAGFAVVAIGVMLGSLVKFHSPPTWVAYIVLAGMGTILIGLCCVFTWYGSEAGVKHSGTLKESVARDR